jgi:hypothetical protein
MQHEINFHPKGLDKSCAIYHACVQMFAPEVAPEHCLASLHATAKTTFYELH